MGFDNNNFEGKIKAPQEKKIVIKKFIRKEIRLPDIEEYRKLKTGRLYLHPVIVNDSFGPLKEEDIVEVSFDPKLDNETMTVAEYLAIIRSNYKDYQDLKFSMKNRGKSNQEIFHTLHSNIIEKRDIEVEPKKIEYNFVRADRDNNSIESRNHDGPIFVRGIRELKMPGVTAMPARDREDYFDQIDEFIVIDPEVLAGGDKGDINLNKRVHIGVQRSADTDPAKKNATLYNPIDYIPDRLEFGCIPRFFLEESPITYGRDNTNGNHLSEAKDLSDEKRPLEETMGKEKYRKWMKGVFATGLAEFNGYLEKAKVKLTDKQRDNIKKSRDALMLVLENFD